jgi:Holliday junction resolvase RusA-like endonuclease
MFKLVVPGRPIVKKNTKRIIGAGKKKMIIYSPKFVEWEKVALLAAMRVRPVNLITCLLEAEYKFYFKNTQGQADTSNLVEGIQDVLTKAGVIQDDKLIMRFTAEKFFGHEPRTEVVLHEYRISA